MLTHKTNIINLINIIPSNMWCNVTRLTACWCWHFAESTAVLLAQQISCFGFTFGRLSGLSLYTVNGSNKSCYIPFHSLLSSACIDYHIFQGESSRFGSEDNMLILMFLCPCRFLWISPSNSRERMMLLCCIQKLLGHSAILTPHPSGLWGSKLSSMGSTGRWMLASISRANVLKESGLSICVYFGELKASWQNLNHQKSLYSFIMKSATTVVQISNWWTISFGILKSQTMNCVSLPDLGKRSIFFNSCQSILWCYA